jgi:hypothetical protein
MPFTQNDQNIVYNAYDLRVSQIRGDYFDYFCEEAVRYYADLFERRKEDIMTDMVRIAGSYPHPKTIRVPLHTFETFVSYDKTYQHALEDTLGKEGAYFKSLTGMNRANMHAIFNYSDFKQTFETRIAPDVPQIYVTLSSTKTESASILTVYSNTLWLNFTL